MSCTSLLTVVLMSEVNDSASGSTTMNGSLTLPVSAIVLVSAFVDATVTVPV